MKWFTKLTKKEILAFQKTQDKNIDNKIKITYSEDYAIVYFYEFGWNKNKKESMATRYRFTDFFEEFDEVFASNEDIKALKQNYVLFMAKKFGKKYIADLLKEKTGIPSKKWSKIFKVKK